MPPGQAPYGAPRRLLQGLKTSGIYVLAGDSRQQMVIDAGHQGAMTAGHGHADALSVCLNSAGQPVLIDPGTCAYVPANRERHAFRATAAHNTLEVDGISQATPRGPFGWRRLPETYVDAWVTGVRRDQAPTRANAQKVEWDEKFGLVKANPLADWTLKEVWAYIHEHDVPYNPLHDQNYPSIGCTHCTRPVMPGEDPRAGRWAGQEKVECGLHPADAK